MASPGVPQQRSAAPKIHHCHERRCTHIVSELPQEIRMYPILIGLCLAAAIGMYFYNNPMNHSRWFLIRRFINWFPLGMTYAFLYMGRYNLNVSKNALGNLMSKEDLGLIFAAGTVTYALSFLINGPL